MHMQQMSQTDIQPMTLFEIKLRSAFGKEPLVFTTVQPDEGAAAEYGRSQKIHGLGLRSLILAGGLFCADADSRRISMAEPFSFSAPQPAHLHGFSHPGSHLRIRLVGYLEGQVLGQGMGNYRKYVTYSDVLVALRSFAAFDRRMSAARLGLGRNRADCVSLALRNRCGARHL